MTLHCHQCGATLAKTARFCGGCGAATRRHRRAVRDRSQHERRRSQRASIAFGVACTATLLGLVTGARQVGDESEWGAVFVGGGVIAATAVLACFVLGQWRSSAPLGVAWRWLGAAVPAALVTTMVSWAYVELLPGADESQTAAVPQLALWVALVVVAPLGEEWLCRGVAWRAGVVMANERTAWVLTSILFAFLHGLSGHLLAVPHRLFSGFAYGFLRWRSGSLLPGIVAHALHNAIAVAWLGG